MKMFAKYEDAAFAFYCDEVHEIIPPDAVEISAETHQKIVAEPQRYKLENGQVVHIPVPRFVQQSALREQCTRAIQAHLDTAARERNYDSIQTAVTYRGDPNPQFAAEAEALFEWRSAVWTYATEQLAAVEAGDREAPETAEAFIEELPPFEWPVLEPSEA